MFNPRSGGECKCSAAAYLKCSRFLTPALEALGPRAVKHQGRRALSARVTYSNKDLLQ